MNGWLAGLATRAAALIAFLAAVAWAVSAGLVGTGEVAGHSMAPSLSAGDRVLVDRWTHAQRLPRRGEIVLVEGPGGDLLVKRVVRVGPSGDVWVEGDNREASSDSRDFGPLSAGRVRGRVVWRYWPISRLGPVR